MPKRSNAFQRVVYIVQSHLAEGSQVKESEELVDRITGKGREVDICVHSTVGGHEVIVSIECRDHARKQPVGWVEEMHAKHSRLPTNLLVLASSSGFTREALKVAEKCGIQTVVPGEIAKSFGEEVERRLAQLWLKMITVTADRVVLTLESVGEVAEEQVVLPAETPVLNADGEVLGPLDGLVTHILQDQIPFGDALRDATGEEKGYKVVASAGEPTPDKPGHFVRKDGDQESVAQRILAFDISGPALVQISPLPLKYGEFQGVEYVYGQARTSTHDVLFVATEPNWEERLDPQRTNVEFSPRSE